MRLIRLLPVALLVVLVAAAVVVHRSGSGSGPGRVGEHETASAAEMLEPADVLSAQALSGTPAGVDPAAAYRRALAERRVVARETALSAPRVASAGWEFVGPSNIGGRVLDLALDPVKPDTVYVA